MESLLLSLTVFILLLPLAGSLIAGLIGYKIGRRAVHWVTNIFVGLSFLFSCYVFAVIVLQGHQPIQGVLYHWASLGNFAFDVSILIDQLSATMMFIVTFISFMVHIYTIGYMKDDEGYIRFFCYVSLFTFAMLALVLADNFLFLFFGWEGVGLVSYLLIGFWFKRESAVFGSLKAFLVNRVSDVGFILALAAILKYFNTLNYHAVFQQIPDIIHKSITLFPGTSSSVITVICVLLFIGAMGKSAQIPLHVWLPESMEGPTPISALIHAATMVTAGIYMVARLSPLFELSLTALSLVLVIGATTCLFTGLLAVFQNDIKRVIAYSTMSQLGYMAIGLGVSAYDAAIFHLFTHAFFKALLFLAAGSVIIALHHEQDMRKMGGLVKALPITYLTFMIGALALAAIPPFSGFYSKDVIIEAVRLSHTPGASYASFCALISVFVTALYIFRAVFLTFHGRVRVNATLQAKLCEPGWVVLLPLIGLAIPSMVIGGMLVGPMLFAHPNLLKNSIFVLPQHNVLQMLSHEFSSASMMSIQAIHSITLWLALAGIVTAWFFTLGYPNAGLFLKKRFSFFYMIMIRKYGFDDFNQIVLVRGTRKLGEFFYYFADLKMIDGVVVNGTGKMIRWFANVSRRMQTGFIYHYALVMIMGLTFFLVWFLLGL